MAVSSEKISSAPARWLPWLWVPTLYFVEGIPNSLVDQVAPIFLKDLGFDNTQIASLAATAYLPWVLKPLWGPLLEMHRTKRWWVVRLQLLGAAAVALLAGVLGAAPLWGFLLAALLLVALLSATHDIVADGFYLYGLEEKAQSFFVGIRNTAYRLAMVFCQGGVVGLVGWLAKEKQVALATAWVGVLLGLAAVQLGLAFYHTRTLPRPANDRPVPVEKGRVWAAFWETWRSFFVRDRIGKLLAFLLLYRLAEVQLVRMAALFLKDARADGGLALGNEMLGLLNGTLGTVAMLGGGILGGVLVAKDGLRRWVWPMVFIMHIPNLAFVGLAHWQPESLWWIGGALVLEKAGYGFGFTAYSIVMLRSAHGSLRTAHFAIMTGLMALGNMIPGYWIGPLQAAVGYEAFFWWVMLCTLPGFWVTWLMLRGGKIAEEKPA